MFQEKLVICDETGYIAYLSGDDIYGWAHMDYLSDSVADIALYDQDVDQILTVNKT